MFFLSNYLFGIFCIHIIWFYFFITGTLIHQNNNNDKDTKIVDVAITSTSGIAITGFVLLLLGFSRQLNIYSFILWLVIESLIFKFIKLQNPFSRYFWQLKISNFFKMFDIPATIIYLIFLIIAVPAVLPATLWDSISYHLAYAVDWANAGRIYVDEFLRYPYYANNFVLIYSLMFILNLGQYCHFITWLSGLLSCLAIYGFISSKRTNLFASKNLLNTDKGKNTFLKIVAFIITFCVIASPIFLRFLNVGYIDIPLGLFIFIPIICAYFSIDKIGRSYEFHTVLNSAFCIGMKISNIVYLPIFVLCVRYACLRKRRKFLYISILCLLMLALSSPWYIRNYIETGDPIPPVINLLLGKEDPIFSVEDHTAVMSELKEQKGFWFLILLPFHFFIDPLSKSFREYGITSSILLLYLPLASLIIFSISKQVRKKIKKNFLFINICLIYLIFIWIGISYLGRYFLHVLPVYVCYLGLCIYNIAEYFRTIVIKVDVGTIKKNQKQLLIKIFTIIFLLALIIPSPSSLAYYKYLINSNYIYGPKALKNYDYFLSQNLIGYSSAKTIINLMKANETENYRVLTIRFENLAYYFRKEDVISIGDWFGPARYKDIIDRVNKSDFDLYITDFNIGSILINKQEALNVFGQDSYDSFVEQIEHAGFIEINSPEKQTSIYLKAPIQR
ncbi:MAG: hypothetical protein QNJ65_23515 [Xenococcaceae cyanobacterium MO_234.B1]|nr:hypothetical protein [Xenococcaceae cyanobacterium MO_234.B1]